MHGGSIAVKSAVEKGSTFIVSLPLSESKQLVAETAQETKGVVCIDYKLIT